MATVLKNSVHEYPDGTKFNIQDDSTGWGDTYAKANITAASILISSPQLDSDITITLTIPQIFAYFSVDGLDLTAEELGIGTYFTDGYYEVKLTFVLDVSPNSDYYINKAGFLEEHKARIINMCKDIEYPLENYSKQNDRIIAKLLLDSAQSALDKGLYTTYQYIIAKINSIFKNYQYEALWP